MIPWLDEVPLFDGNQNEELFCEYLLDPAHLKVVSALHGFCVLLAPPLRCPHLHLGGLDE